jgi:hypothetical protein
MSEWTLWSDVFFWVDKLGVGCQKLEKGNFMFIRWCISVQKCWVQTYLLFSWDKNCGECSSNLKSSCLLFQSGFCDKKSVQISKEYLGRRIAFAVCLSITWFLLYMLQNVFCPQLWWLWYLILKNIIWYDFFFLQLLLTSNRLGISNR